ncbi:MAG: M23 family metallopeptidase [Microbacteriaceae bacterium]
MRYVLLAVLLLAASGPSFAVADPGETADAAPTWVWPVDPPRVVDRPFLAPATPYSAGHRGVDLRAALGAEVRAPAAGIVHFAGVVVDRPVLSIRHPGGLISSYEPVLASRSAGEPVSAGEIIGTVVVGDHCVRFCLHLGVRVDGEYVSPMRYLGVVPRAVLLPTRPIR